MMSGMLTSALNRTRSGIRFDVVAATLPEAMPRMDVAAFIGFAERGPLHCPVAIEDMVQFERQFGVTPLLGWGADGRRLSGHLAESVRAFFRQGGRRCWVVRVAADSARSNRFVIPGLYRVSSTQNQTAVIPVQLQARSVGSWSDTLHVSSRLQERAVYLLALDTVIPDRSWQIRVRSDFVRPGDLLRIIDADNTRQIFFPITSVDIDAASGDRILHAQQCVTFFRKAKQEKGKLGWDRGEFVDVKIWLAGRAAIVTMELSVRDEKNSNWRLGDLGMTPMHGRYCAVLPNDIESVQGSRADAGNLAQDHTVSQFYDAWFPLAGLEDRPSDDAAGFMVPLEMSGSFGEERGADPQAASALERDGLASFDAALFLDPALRYTSIAELMMTANALRYSAPHPRCLRGIHAVLGWFGTVIQDEVTLLSLPDAMHTPWHGQRQPSRYTCRFVTTLSESMDALPPDFLSCGYLPSPLDLAARMSVPNTTTLHLSWRMPEGWLVTDGREIEYQVQEAANGDFHLVDGQWNTDQAELNIEVRQAGERTFRVRATSGGISSNWSDAIAVQLSEVAGDMRAEDTSGAVGRELHRAAIRLCAAHGELFVVLSLAADSGEQTAADHVRALSANDALLGTTFFDPDGRVGSYAALYHPWIETRGMDGEIRVIPPDGALLGMYAARAYERGAWLAPANRALRGVLALHTALSETRQSKLMDAGINLVLQRPEGYTLLSEDTLSSVTELKPIHVRRLLILLRRMIASVGEELTFEPNDLTLRDLVKQRCVNLLQRLFRAGAFDGRSIEEAFQVSVDDVNNTPNSIDAGRLIVSVRIRPAQTLRFITIRFALGGAATGISEEGVA